MTTVKAQRFGAFIAAILTSGLLTGCTKEYELHELVDTAAPEDTGPDDVDAPVRKETECSSYDTVGQISSPGLGWTDTKACVLSNGVQIGTVGSRTLTSVSVAGVNNSPVPGGDVRLIGQTDDGSPQYPDANNLRTANGESATANTGIGWDFDTSFLGNMNSCYPTCDWVEVVLEIQDQTRADSATCSDYIPTVPSVEVCMEWEYATAARSAPINSQCEAGSGTFRLIPRKFIDNDGDDNWSAIMIPVQTSGTGKLTGHAWITSATINEDQGQTLRILKPVPGFRFASNDQLVTPNAVSLPLNATNTWIPGVISGNAPVVGIEMPKATTAEFEVDLAWECGTLAIPQERTPPQGYIVDPDAIGCIGDMPQQFTIRPVPALAPTKLIVERYGYSDERHAVDLSSSNGSYTFNHKRGEFHFKGSLSSLTANGATLDLTKAEVDGTTLCTSGTYNLLPEG